MPPVLSRSPRRLLVAFTLLLFAMLPSAALADPPTPVTPVPVPTPTTPVPATPVPTPAPAHATPVPAPTPAPSIGPASFVGTYPGGAPIPLSTQTNGDQVYLNAPKTAVEDASAHGCASVKVRIALNIPGAINWGVDLQIGSAWTELYAVGGEIYESFRWFPACLSQPGPITLTYYTYNSGSPYFLWQAHTVPLGQFTMIDPSGIAYDQTLYDAAIAHGATPRQARSYAAVGGASVTLQSSTGGAFTDVPADASLTPSVNPQTTATYGGARGQFAWKVAPGSTYRAIVTADGYASATSPTVEADPVLTGMYTPLHAVCPNGETPDYSGVAAFPSNGSDYPTYPTWDYPTYPETSTNPVYTGYPDYPGYPLDYPGATRLPFTCHPPACPAGQVGVPPNCQTVIAPPTPTLTPTPEPTTGGQVPQSDSGTPGTAPKPTPTPTPVPKVNVPKLIAVAFGKHLTVDKKHGKVTLTCAAASAVSGGSCTITVALGKKKSGTRLLKSKATLKGTSKTITLTFTSKAWSKARKSGKITITLTLIDGKGVTQTLISKTISVR